MSRTDERARARLQSTRRGSTVTSDSSPYNEDVAKQIENTLSPMLERFERLQERVAVLWGDVQQGRDKATVRRADLSSIDDINDTREAVKASGANPTKAEFDALVDEVAAIRQAIEAIAEKTRVL